MIITTTESSDNVMCYQLLWNWKQGCVIQDLVHGFALDRYLAMCVL